VAGVFITFEGSEGCGKTTQIKSLSNKLKTLGKNVEITREPGGTQIGESIRHLLQDPLNTDKITPITELLLFSACRSELSERIIKPALARGDFVVCDRFYDSTYVYQGIGRSLNLSYIEQLKTISVGTLIPDLTIILDLNASTGLERAENRQSGTLDRIEAESLQFFEKIRQGYLDLAKSEPERFFIIDGSLSVQEIESIIWDEVKKRFLN
jgi:dTMP kinase